MRTRISLALFLAFASVFPKVTEAQSNQLTSPIPGGIPTPEWNWGMFTNGICAEAGVSWWDRPHDRPPLIQVRVVNTNVNGFYGGAVREDIDDARVFLAKFFSDAYLFFQPTNLFCGVIELQDAHGRKLPALRPDLNSPGSYPDSFSYAEIRTNNPYAPMHFPVPLQSWWDQLARFEIRDHFVVPDPGAYKLTVWAKIYQRATTNDNVCHRLDLPPVSVMVRWGKAEPNAK